MVRTCLKRIPRNQNDGTKINVISAGFNSRVVCVKYFSNICSSTVVCQHDLMKHEKRTRQSYINRLPVLFINNTGKRFK